jgi:hypothetical protein
MNEIQKDILAIGTNVDWPKIKQIIGEVLAALKVVCDLLPPGMIKSILSGVLGVLNIIYGHLPG